MELPEAYAETLPDCDHDVGQQGGTIGVEEPVESSSDAIVAEMLQLMGLQPKEPAGKPLLRSICPTLAFTSVRLNR